VGTIGGCNGGKMAEVAYGSGALPIAAAEAPGIKRGALLDNMKTVVITAIE